MSKSMACHTGMQISAEDDGDSYIDMKTKWRKLLEKADVVLNELKVIS